MNNKSVNVKIGFELGYLIMSCVWVSLQGQFHAEDNSHHEVDSPYAPSGWEAASLHATRSPLPSQPDPPHENHLR